MRFFLLLTILLTLTHAHQDRPKRNIQLAHFYYKYLDIINGVEDTEFKRHKRGIIRDLNGNERQKRDDWRRGCPPGQWLYEGPRAKDGKQCIPDG